MPNFNLFDFSSIEQPRASAKFSPQYASIPESKPSMPKLGFGGVSTLRQFNPETMSEYSPEVFAKAREIAPTFKPSVSKPSIRTSMPSLIPQASASGQYDDTDLENLQILKGMGITGEDAINIVNEKKAMREGTPETPSEELSFGRKVGEGLIGAGRVGEQIPRYIGNIGKVTGTVMGAPYEASKALFGEEAGLTSFLAPGAKQMQRAGAGAQALGEEITRAGMTDGGAKKLTEEQIKARKTGADILATTVAPIGKGVQATSALGALKSGAKIGALGTPLAVGMTEGRLPTLGEQVIGTAAGGLLSGAGYGVGKALGKVSPKVVDAVADEAKQAEQFVGKQVKAKFGDKIVNIPEPKTTISGVLTTPFKETDTSRLVNSALKPSYAGKTPKQIVGTIKNTEANVKEFHKAVRTGELTGNLETLGDSAETVINNLDTVGKRIGGYIEKLKGNTSVSKEARNEMKRALTNKIEARSGAYPILKKFYTDTTKGLPFGDAFKAKRIYQNEITKLIKSGDAGTDSFNALIKGVNELDTNIDAAIEKMGIVNTRDKQLYKMLKSIAADIAKSSQVEARRSPMTFTEQMGTIEALVDGLKNPLSAANRLYAKEIGELNTRGGTWKQLMDVLDKKAISDAKTIVKPTVKTGIIKKK